MYVFGHHLQNLENETDFMYRIKLEILKQNNVCSSTNFNHPWNTPCSEKGFPVSACLLVGVMLQKIQTSNHTHRKLESTLKISNHRSDARLHVPPPGWRMNSELIEFITCGNCTFSMLNSACTYASIWWTVALTVSVHYPLLLLTLHKISKEHARQTMADTKFSEYGGVHRWRRSDPNIECQKSSSRPTFKFQRLSSLTACQEYRRPNHCSTQPNYCHIQRLLRNDAWCTYNQMHKVIGSFTLLYMSFLCTVDGCLQSECQIHLAISYGSSTS